MGFGLQHGLVYIGKAQADPDGFSIQLGKVHQVRVDDHFHLCGQVVDFMVGQRHKSPVLLPGSVVDSFHTLDFLVEALHVDGADYQPLSLLGLFGHAQELAGQALRVKIKDGGKKIPGIEVLSFGESGSFYELLVVAGVVGHQHNRW